MKTFQSHLKEKLKDKEFKELFLAEKQLLDLSLKIHEIREKKGISQIELASKAKITQQQLSKIENGINCNITTFLKVCNALDIKVDIHSQKKKVG
jgi:DNA-binding XRE family transcriptional regulator